MAGKVRDSIVPNAIHTIEPNTIVAADLHSEGEAAGLVLTSDGADGAYWAAPTPISFYLGDNAGQTSNLGAAFLAAAGRAHVRGDMCVYRDTVASGYRMCIATGTGASDFLEMLAVIP